MHVPGMGVRNFQFAQLYDGMAPQNTIYNGSASDSVVAALNGYVSYLRTKHHIPYLCT
jgi:hypothetical protein